MTRRIRRKVAVAGAIAALAVGVGATAGPASAYCCAYNSLTFTIYEGQVATYAWFWANNVSQIYHWQTNMPHSNRISNNLCSNYNLYYYSDYAAHDTSYHQTGWFTQGTCFALRGRSFYGTQTGNAEMWY